MDIYQINTKFISENNPGKLDILIILFIKSLILSHGITRDPYFGSSVANIFVKLALSYFFPALSDGYLSDKYKIHLR
jgi:hypothetical protein